MLRWKSGKENGSTEIERRGKSREVDTEVERGRGRKRGRQISIGACAGMEWGKGKRRNADRLRKEQHLSI